MQLAGQVALVTGGGSGIGRAVALALAAEGAAVGVLGRRAEPLAATVAAIAAAGGAGLALPGDVGVEAEVDGAVATLMDRHGRLDVVVNSAGIYVEATAIATDPATWDRVFATNVRGAYLVSRRTAAEMAPARSGAIVNVSSTIGARPIPGAAAYCASKAALEALTKALALELAADGVRVNAVVPGIVDTPIHDSRAPERRDEYRKQAAALHPLARMGRPDDVAAAVLFLVSPAASWITGALFTVDGGISLR